MSWRGEVCQRCGRRNCVGFVVLDAIWTAVVKGRWAILCTTCFDYEAEAAGIAYAILEAFPVSWSDWED